jgi:hypothetical protein
MIKAVLIAIALPAAGVLGDAAMKPDQLHVERTVTINASPERIFPLIEDFHAWHAWSPYEKRDPAMRKTYAGSPKGRGAVYQWNGNRNVGEGRMEILSASPANVAIKLDFDRPMKGHNIAQFTMKPKGAATDVTWSMEGDYSYVARVTGIFVNMDNMIGNEFQAGLTALKALAER